MIQPHGAVQRVLRSEVLGPVSQIASRREARILLQSQLAALNSGRRGAIISGAIKGRVASLSRASKRAVLSPTCDLREQERWAPERERRPLGRLPEEG